MPTVQTHLDFIQANMPAWLKQASRAQQERFKTLTQQLQRDSDVLNALLSGLPAPHDFALNLLQAQPEVREWPSVNGVGSVADAVRRARVRRTPFGASLSAVEAAMRNYSSDDTASSSDFEKNGQLFIKGKPEEFYRWNTWTDTAIFETRPSSFAQLCRRVDVGGAYQRELEQRLPRIGAQTPPIASAHMAYARSLLAYDAYEAKLSGRLDETGQRLLADVGVQLEVQPVDALSCEVKALELLAAPLFGARLYWAREGDEQGVRPVVLHMPHDGVAPLKQFASVQAMTAELTERVRKRSYRESLMRYLPVRLQARLGSELLDQVEWTVDRNLNIFQEIHARVSGWREGELGEDRTQQRIRVPDPRVSWGHNDLREGPWHSLYHEWRGHALANATALMVPTKDQDWQTMLARLDYWESFAEQAMMLAATFFPFCAPLGVAMGVVGGAQLIHEFFDGIHAFNEGHAQEGIDHIFNVLFGVAQGAYLGFVGGPAEPMALRDGSTRLWDGDVSAFEALTSPPIEAEQDSWGVWRTPDRAWVSIDDTYFEVQGSKDALSLRLPKHHRGVNPPLDWNPDRGWHWAHKSPLLRDNLTLLRSFSETPVELDDATILAQQGRVGVSEAYLRELQVGGRPLPAILGDALNETRNWQWLRRSIEQLRRGDAPGAMHFRIAQTLVDVPGWPTEVSLRYDDGVQTHRIGNPAATRFLDLHATDLDSPGWAARILGPLSADEQSALVGQTSIGLSPRERSQHLATRWAQHLERHSPVVIDAMVPDVALDPLAAPLQRSFPGLPDTLANELVVKVRGEDLLLLKKGQVSQGLGQQCVETLRELRLVHALRDLERGVSSADRDRIVMGLLGHDRQLLGKVRLRLEVSEPRDTRLQLRPHETFDTLEVGETGPLKTINQEGERYRPHDENGNDLGGLLGLEEALLRAMPDEARKAMGLNMGEVYRLRAQLLEQAHADRQSLRGYLNIRRPGHDRPHLQWLNGRLGYPLSGRGRLPLQRWRGTSNQRIERLYPGHAGDTMPKLRKSLTDQAGRQGLTVDDLLTRLETEWATLNEGLRQWEVREGVHHPAESNFDRDGLISQRKTVAEIIRRAWRREPDPFDNSIGVIRLSQYEIGRLPPITGSFEHIEELYLDRMGLTEDPSDFLRLFPDADEVYLQSNQLTAIPVAAGESSALVVLSIGDNPLIMGADMFAPLLGSDRATQLQSLHLSGISSGAEAVASAGMVTAIGRLAELPALRELVWADNPTFTPQELVAITALPRLRGLDLSRCDLLLNEQGSAFLRTAQALEDLRLNDNNCRALPDLPELTVLRELELAHSRLDRVPALALKVLSRQSDKAIRIDLKGNRITNIQEDLLPALSEIPASDTRKVEVLLDDNPLPSAQIQTFRDLQPEGFRYTVDAWLNQYPGLQKAMEVARDDPGGRLFIDWFSTPRSELNAKGRLSSRDRQRSATLMQHYTGYRSIHSDLQTRVLDFDQQLRQLRKRLHERSSDRHPPDLSELELHFIMFELVMKARVERQPIPYEVFLNDHYEYWDYRLQERYPDAAQRERVMTREAFIDWLCDTQDTFNATDMEPRTGEMTWRPYLGLMSRDWGEGLAIWDRVDADLVDVFDSPVDPSHWPQTLLDNLVNPDPDLPSAWEPLTQSTGTVWRRAKLEPVADVEWGSGQPVTLNEDQLRRTMAIYRSVKSREIEVLARRTTTGLVNPWWLRPMRH